MWTNFVQDHAKETLIRGQRDFEDRCTGEDDQPDETGRSVDYDRGPHWGPVPERLRVPHANADAPV